MRAQVLPGVGGLENPLADRDVAADARFTGAGPHRARIRGRTAMSPIECTGWPSKIGSHVMPPSVVLNDAARCRAGVVDERLPGTPATALMRLPSGPICRHGSRL